MSPLLNKISRKKINKNVKKLAKAKKENPSNLWIQDGDIMGSVDYKGMKREYNSSQKLKKSVEKRKNGLIGFIRKLTANKEKLQRVQNINELKKKRNEINEKMQYRNTLAKIHPKLKGLRLGDYIQTINLRENIREGRIIEVKQDSKGNYFLGLQMNNDAKITRLYLDKLKKLRILKK